MKKLSLLLAILSFSAVSQAADISQCLNKLDDSCRQLNAHIFDSLSRNNVGCKIVSGGARESDGTRYDRKVVFFDSNSIVSIATPQSNGQLQKCHVAMANIGGSMIDNKASAGRLYVANSQGKLFAVTRTNKVYEVLNLQGQSFTAINKISMDETNLKLQMSYKAMPTVFSLEELTHRVNDPYRAHCVSNNCQQK